jgi:DNA-binding MarR family transcriptional regulator
VTSTPDKASPPAAIAADLRAMIGQLRRRLQEQSQLGDLTPSQSAVLLRLWREGPATVTAMARAEGVRPQSMGATVAALETAGLVRGEPDPGDGRQTILSMTEDCKERIRLGSAAKQDFLARAIATQFTAAEWPELERAVRLLGRLADVASTGTPDRE